MTKKHNSGIRRIFQDQRGSVALIVALSLTAVAGLGGLVTQEAILYRTQTALQASTNLAALAGAQDIINGTATATATVNSYTALNPISGQTVTMASGYPQLKCLTSTGVSCSGPNNANAIVVQQQATVPLIFGGLFGKSTTVVSATATAGAGGGTSMALDVMLIVDTTASMNDSDTSCSVSGATRETCAEAGARTLLQQFNPSLVHVGLMVFPGLTTGTEAAYTPYNCSTGPEPTTTSYKPSGSAPVYQIIPFSSDYKTSATATSLNTSSNLVRALQGGPSGCQQGLAALGGYGTYYAGVITAAQTALTTNGRTGVQKVIVLLSDGGANASSSNVPSGMASNQCHEAITAAQTVTAAGTWVYSAAYGSSTATGSQSTCTTDSPSISACATMQQIASKSSMFFIDTSGGSTSCTSTINGSTTDLVALFTNLGTSLTTPRLLSNDTT
jgi:Putative Tad-like Flp pilus-assembly